MNESFIANRNGNREEEVLLKQAKEKDKLIQEKKKIGANVEEIEQLQNEHREILKKIDHIKKTTENLGSQQDLYSEWETSELTKTYRENKELVEAFGEHASENYKKILNDIEYSLKQRGVSTENLEPQQEFPNEKKSKEEVLQEKKIRAEKINRFADKIVASIDEPIREQGYPEEYLADLTESQLKKLLGDLEKKGDDANYLVVEKVLGQKNPHFAERKSLTENETHDEEKKPFGEWLKTLDNKGGSNEQEQSTNKNEGVDMELKKIEYELEEEMKGKYRAQVNPEQFNQEMKDPWESWIERNDQEKAEAIPQGQFRAPEEEPDKQQELGEENIQAHKTLEQQLQDMEKKPGAFGKAMGKFGNRLLEVRAIAKARDYYRSYATWVNKGNRWQKLGKRVLVGAGIGAVFGAGGLAVAGGLAAVRVLASAGAGAVAGEIHKKATQKKLGEKMTGFREQYDREYADQQGFQNQNQTLSYEQGNEQGTYVLVNQARLRELAKKTSLSESETAELATLRKTNQDNHRYLQDLRKRKAEGTLSEAEQKFLDRMIETTRKVKADRLRELRSQYHELRLRALTKNERNRNMVSAAAGLLTGLSMHYGTELLNNLSSGENVPQATLEDTRPVSVEDRKLDPMIEPPEPAVVEQVEVPQEISKDAFINKGEGITHALLRQLNASAELREAFGIEGSATGADAARVAREFGYIGDNGSEVRVLWGEGAAYELTLDENGKPTVNEYTGGSVVENRYEGGSRNESHETHKTFEGDNTERKYEYLHNSGQNIEYQGAVNVPSSLEDYSIKNEAGGGMSSPLLTAEPFPGRIYQEHVSLPGVFDSSYKGISGDSAIGQLFEQHGMVFNQENFEKLGFRYTTEGPRGAHFYNVHDTTPHYYTWQDIYERFDIAKAKELYVDPQIDMRGAVDVPPSNTESGFEDLRKNNVDPFEVFYDNEGGVNHRANENFIFDGPIESEFSNREMRLIEKGKMKVEMSINDERFGDYNNVKIMKLNNGQYALQMAGEQKGVIASQLRATESVQNFLDTFGMSQATARHYVINPLEGADGFVTNVYVPLSDEQAKFIGRTYSNLGMALGNRQ